MGSSSDQKSLNRYAISVCVPTFNRRHTLGRLIDSLNDQSFRDFELVLIDDGSEDGTEEYIRSIRENLDFPIKYEWQINQGKHVALNRAFDLADGELSLLVGSDDILLPNALTTVKEAWDSIPNEEKHRFVGIEGLTCSLKTGKITGDIYPSTIHDSNPVLNRYFYGVKGDKAKALRTEIVQRYKWPTITGEKYIAPSAIWNRLSINYMFRCVNKPIIAIEYLPDGISRNSATMRACNPLGTRLVYFEFITVVRDAVRIKFRFLMRGYINFIRFSLHGCIRLRQQMREVPSLILFLISFPAALILWLKDRKLLSEGSNSGGMEANRV